MIRWKYYCLILLSLVALIIIGCAMPNISQTGQTYQGFSSSDQKTQTDSESENSEEKAIQEQILTERILQAEREKLLYQEPPLESRVPDILYGADPNPGQNYISNRYRFPTQEEWNRIKDSRGGMMGGGLDYMTNLDTPQIRSRAMPYRANRQSGIQELMQNGELLQLLDKDSYEVWVLIKPEAFEYQEQSGHCGAMTTLVEEKEVPLPLKHTDVRGQVSGYIATVSVTQQFHNPFDKKIEAVYVFPLPQNAAVNEFVMTIGDRKIRGIIRERQEAEQIYREARQQGFRAALLNQERPNIFTQKVANIEPGKEIDVNIHYFNTLAYREGWYEFVFPMVVGPRYNPAGSTDGVGAVARDQTGASGQDTEVTYLAPTERSGHDIDLQLTIDAGVAIEEVECLSHAIVKESLDNNQVAVRINPRDRIPNKDFVLRYRVAGDRVKSSLLTHNDPRGNYFTLMLYPPDDLKRLKRAPMEMIFVLDCSGSMGGRPIELAKGAIIRALQQLEDGDSFQVIRFSNDASQLGAQPLKATDTNIRKAIKYVEALEGQGGTEMIEGIKAALDFDHDPKRLRVVSFMTDGYIGNEADILAAVHEKVGGSRIFSFGVGSSVNRFLLERMAGLGRGAVAYITLNDPVVDVVDRFYECISHPALTDIQIDWGAMQVSDVYPAKMSDLFVGRPVIITGKYQGQGRSVIRISGNVGPYEHSFTVPVDLDHPGQHEGIACVWARKKIEQLNNHYLAIQEPGLPEQIQSVALEYGLMSAYTSFIAVDSAYRTEGDHGISLAVPVPVPDGVRYETTIQQ